MFGKEEKERAIRRMNRAHSNAKEASQKFESEGKNLSSALQEIQPVLDQAYNLAQEMERSMVERQEIKAQTVERKSIDGSTAGAVALAGIGAVSGIGLATVGASAALAAATAFGTASTGVAIASLSGAAATNAALALLGGGAVAAGGGGIAAGEALLAAMGPAGWVIGGVALLGGGIAASNKNKKAASQAHSQARELEALVEKLNSEISIIRKHTEAVEYWRKDLYPSVCYFEDMGDALPMVDEDEYADFVNRLKQCSKTMNEVNDYLKKFSS